MDSEANIETTFDPPTELCRAIDAGLHEHNLGILGPDVINNYARFAVTARNPQGELQGGLLAQLIWGGLKIDTLWVDPACRGQDTGSRLLAQAEATARQRGSRLMILETTSFQARGFYEKHGFSVYGQIDDYPQGHCWYHMIKRL